MRRSSLNQQYGILHLTTVQLLACVAATNIPINIGGIFPMTTDGGGWPGGQACLPAAQMALEDVNKRNVLPGYVLHMQHNDSACQPGLGARVMYDLLYTDPAKLVLLSGCSLVTTLVAEAANQWQLLVLSYGASSPALSNRERFPTLFRTHPSATIHNPTRVALFENFHWSKIAILQVAEEVFTETAKDLERECQAKGIQIVSHQSFYGDPTDALKSLKKQDARIIVGLFYEKVARKVFCQVFKEGLFGRRYVWFLIGWYSDTWFHPQENEDLDCSLEEMTIAVQYHLTTEAMMLNPEERPGATGMTGQEFQSRLKQRLIEKGYNKSNVKNVGGFVEAPLAYDAIWALALALNCTRTSLKPLGLRLENFSYEEGERILAHLKRCMRDANFEGVSGPVSFSSEGDRIAQTQVEQMQDGHYCKAFIFDGTENNLQQRTFSNEEGDCNQIKWYGQKVPRDQPLSVRQALATKPSVYIPIALMALLLACTCTAAGIFNWENKTKRVIAYSQVQCNNLLVFGCMVAVISVFFWGLPVEGMKPMQPKTFSAMCHARVVLLSFGFTVSFGCMFAKVWTLYRFGSGHQDRRAIAKQKPVPASKFYVILGILLFIDVCVLGVWMEADKMKLHEETFKVIDDIDQDRLIKPFIQKCHSKNEKLWLGLTLGPKLVLILLAVFIAYESRNLRLRFVNDTTMIALAVYNVAVLGMITTPVLLFLIHNQPNAQFAFIAVSVLTCVFVSLLLIFAPKVVQVWRDGHDKDGNKRSDTMAPDVFGSPTKQIQVDERKKEKLLREIAAVKKAIEAKDTQICQLRQRLNKARAAREANNNKRDSVTEDDSTVVAVTVHHSTSAPSDDGIMDGATTTNPDSGWVSGGATSHHQLPSTDDVGAAGDTSLLYDEGQSFDWLLVEEDKVTVV